MPEMTPEPQINPGPTSFEEAKEQLLMRMSEDPSSCELYSSIAMNAEAVALVFSKTLVDATGLMDELLKIHEPHCEHGPQHSILTL
jgi:hypothetical protein